MEQPAATQTPFPDSLVKVVVCEINGERFPLKRFTIRQEMKLKQAFGGSLEGFSEKLKQLDGETLLRTLLVFMEPNEKYKTFDDFADNLDCTMDVKWNIFNAITMVIVGASPETQDLLKKNLDHLKSRFQKEINERLTGSLSSIDSSAPTDGAQTTS